MPGAEQVLHPATGALLAEVPVLGPEEVAALAARGRAAQPAWEALGFEGRGRVLRRMQRWVLDHRDELIEVIRSETGKTYEDALLAEISYGADAFGYWARRAPEHLADERVPARGVLTLGKRLVVRHRPHGLVGVIGPWNYPLVNGFGDGIPALAAGNAVLLKPSELTPLTSLRLAEGLRACGMPEGVLQVATGDGATGGAVVDAADMVMFTGSTATGRAIMARAAQTLTPVSLELGGKDPMIVLADADLERAAHTAVYYGMLNGGQTCVSIERVYVEEAVHDAFVALVVGKVRALRQGFGGPGTHEVGAMTAASQVAVVAAHVQDARDRGARVLAGGTTGEHAAGHWYAPTVLVDVDHTMLCMTEETFGPTLPIMRVRDAEEAIRLANDSRYGLGASVFGADVRRAEEVARRLEAGAVCVNDAVRNYAVLDLPMGGVKASGIGSRHGAGGIRKFCRQQALYVSRVHLRHDVHTYPYTPRRTALLGRLFDVLYGRGRRD